MAGTFIDCEANLSASFGTTSEDVSGSVDEKSGEVQSKLDAIKKGAEGIQDQAESMFNAVQGAYSNAPGPGGAGSISFSVSPLSFSPSGAASVTAPSKYTQAPETGSLGDPPVLRVQAFEPSQFSEPTNQQPIFADTPEAPTAVPPPSPPGDTSVSFPEPPGQPSSSVSVSSPGGAPSFQVQPPEVDPVEIAPAPDYQIPRPDLSELERIQSAARQEFDLQPYARKLVTTALTLVNNMTQKGVSAVVNTATLHDSSRELVDQAARFYNHRLDTLWSRRGLSRDHNAHIEHASKVRDRTLRDHDRATLAADQRWEMEALPTLLQAAADAHTFIVELQIKLYDLEFEQVRVQQQALLGLYEIAARNYELKTAQVQERLLSQAEKLSKARAAMEEYSAFVDSELSKADLNSAISQSYASAQQAKLVAVDVFRAQVQAGAAEIQAFNERARGVRAEAEGLSAQLAAYQAKVANWSAQVEDARNEYAAIRSRNQAIAAQNRSAAIQVSSEAVSAEATAQAAQQSAMDTAVTVAQLNSQSKNKLAQQYNKDSKNQAQLANWESSVSLYRHAAAEFSAQAESNRAEIAGLTTANDSVVRSAETVGSAAVDAAQLTQQYRIQMAEAYVDLYAAAADAEASQIAGSLAGYRATVGLFTSGNLDYTSSMSEDVSMSNSYADSEDKSCQRLYEPATF